VKSETRRRNIPAILNYTGEIIKIYFRKDEDRFKSQKGEMLILPPIGRPTVEVIKKLEEGALFASEMHVVRGIPPQMQGIMYVVQDNVAKLLYGVRNDLLVIYNKRVESSKNVLRPEEIVLVGDDFAYFSVEVDSD
jgi:hypothetical protein